MLYDPKWETEPKTIGVTLAGLISWLERQDPEQSYDYASNTNCLVCQFLKYQGLPAPRAGASYWREHIGTNKTTDLPDNVFSILNNGKTTFGAVLERARAALVTDI